MAIRTKAATIPMNNVKRHGGKEGKLRGGIKDGNWKSWRMCKIRV